MKSIDPQDFAEIETEVEWGEEGCSRIFCEANEKLWN